MIQASHVGASMRTDAIDTAPTSAAGRAAIPPCRFAAIMVLAMALVDLAWNLRAGLDFHGWARPIGAIALLLLLTGFYSFVRRRAQIAETALYAALWIAFTLFGAIQTYLGASWARPLIDEVLVRADQWMGFDWIAWVSIVRAHPALTSILRLAYFSLTPQIVGTIFILALCGVRGRNEELLLNVGVALAITTLIACPFPAMGGFVHYGFGTFEPSDLDYAAHMALLRQPVVPAFDLGAMQGIDDFPSYHTVLACLFVYAHRGLKWTFGPMLAINAVMLVSIVSEGGHYLIDVFAGGAVAALAMLATTMALRIAGRDPRSATVPANRPERRGARR